MGWEIWAQQKPVERRLACQQTSSNQQNTYIACGFAHKERRRRFGYVRINRVAAQHLQLCSVCDLAKIFLTSKFSYLPFFQSYPVLDPTHKN
jgi:hypothetical protein